MISNIPVTNTHKSLVTTPFPIACHPNHSQSPSHILNHSQPFPIIPNQSRVIPHHPQPVIPHHSQPAIPQDQPFPKTSHSPSLHTLMCSRSVTIRALRKALVMRPTSKAYTAASVCAVIFDAKKRMTELSTVDPIRPSVHMLRELCRPPCTSDVDGTLMVEV